MKKKYIFLALTIILTSLIILNCSKINTNKMNEQKKILFLHHSTGFRIWKGGKTDILSRILYKMTKRSVVEKWFLKYNKKNFKKYIISEKNFPKKEPYGWKNYPYDYYNIWVKNAGPVHYMEEPTLEMLTKENDLIIWKHCFPVGNMLESEVPDINSEIKTLENYKLQYKALKTKMHEFPETKFLIWTGAALVEGATDEKQAKRASAFHNWVINEWDEQGDNIFIWDFYDLETEGGLYLAPDNATSPNNSHPSSSFSKKVFPYFCNRIVDVIENNGDSGNISGKP